MALPQRHRLKGQRVFDQLYRRGRASHGPFLMLRWLPADPSLLGPAQQGHGATAWRCGVVVSSKVHKRAVQRNRLRRLLHNHLVQLPIGRPEAPVWLLVSCKPGSAERDPASLLGECDQLLLRAGLSR
ncbi:MAG: ribonuclease P protein component [Cyanobium sp.]